MSSKKEKGGSGGSTKQKQPNNRQDGNKSQKKQGKQGGNQRKGSINQGNEEDVKRDQKLQAVLLADSFTQTFRPITLETAKVLLPIVNIPMIDYTIELLAQNGVEEVIVYCVWYASAVEEYLMKSKWPQQLSIRCITSTTCTSAGDALRDLDSQNIVRSDPFILVSGDVVSNMNLRKAIDFHKMKRKLDPNNIMTCVFKKVQRLTPSKPLLDDLIVGVNQTTSQILLFDDMIESNEVNLSLELLSSNNTNEITFLTDLLDCHIDICSQEMLLQFSDNFDYQDIRQHFIRNEVTNFALGKHLYAYILQNEYAARVKDPHTYHAISRDIVTRWVYPFVPDIQLLDDSCYVQSKRYVYKSQGVKIHRSALVEEEVVIGRGTTVGPNSTISKTIIGKDNSIGSDVKIVNSHIWSNVVIEDNVNISGAIICDGAIIRSGAVLSRGCIISYGVEVRPGVQIGEFVRLTKYNAEVVRKWEPDSDCRFYQTKKTEMGADSITDLSLEREVRISSIGCVEEENWRRDLWCVVPPPAEEDDDDEFDEQSYEDLRLNTGDRGADSSLVGFDAGLVFEETDGDDDVVRDAAFCRNIVELVMAAMKEGHPAESTLLEIKGLKFAQNKSFGDCLQGVIVALFSFILEKSTMAQTILQLLKQQTKKDSLIYMIVQSLTQDVRNQIEIISFIEDFAMQSIYIQPLFRFILQTFHDAGTEVMDEESEEDEDEVEAMRLLSTKAILSWALKRKSLPEIHPRSRFIRDVKVAEFVEWLDEEDESGEEDEGDEEEEESEDSVDDEDHD